MKIAVISDIHDNLVNLEKCLNWLKTQKIESLICCGDVTNFETLGVISKKFSGDIFLVYGNMEIYEKEEVEKHGNIKFLGRIGRIELGERRIGICHEPYFINEVMGRGKCDIIFYGHTHRPFEEMRDGIKIINPGTLGGVFQKSTFAIYDSEKNEAELKILELI